jgi:hypothetical protein
MKGQAFLTSQELAPSPPLSNPCSQIHSLLLEDKVDYGIGYSYRSEPIPDRPVRQLYSIVNFIPPSQGL